MTLYTPITTVTQITQTIPPSQPLVVPPTVSSTPEPLPTPSTAPKPITPSTIGSQGHIINTEGCYQISDSLNYQGPTSVITIASSNVTLDLNGQTITYSGNPPNAVHGIIIKPGTSNIRIRNGTIMGFPGIGILAPGTSEKPINHLTVESIKIVSCYEGIILCTTHNTTLSNCLTIANLNPHGTTHGFKCNECSGITMQLCMSHNNTSLTCNCYGYLFSHCKNTFLNQCTASGNEGNTETAGICLENMYRNNYIQGCMCNGNYSSNGKSYGILLTHSNQTFLCDSALQGNSASGPDCSSYGLYLRHSSRNFIKHNIIDGNDYGIYDDESYGQHTNIFSQNIACQNTHHDYLRPYSSPLSFISVKQEYLQGILAAGALDNISIRI